MTVNVTKQGLVTLGELLKRRKRKMLVEILAFSLMPNHIHLLIRQLRDGGISKFMQKFGGYVLYYNKKYGRKGHLFQDKFQAVHIQNEEQLKTAFVYIHTNPVAIIYPGWKEKGIKNKQGKNFSKTNIAHILRNVVYVGKIKHNNEIYQGIHEPVISEEIFALAQKIHKEKKKNFRVYKNFLFGGLIQCEECGSKMTSCFTNKKDNGKLKRYYYYRCTSTLRQDWQTCSIKQVSAERLENFALENLERISIDKNYIENLVFRLNHSSNPELKNSAIPHQAGYEPTQVCSKFSPETISSTLKFFLSGLSKKKGIEKNLWTKNFIEKIIYSKEHIKFSLFYRENWENLAAENSPAPRERGGASARSADWGNIISSKNGQFVSYSMAPRAGFEPATTGLTVQRSTIELPRNKNCL